jgi:CRISPR-associated protein Csm3
MNHKLVKKIILTGEILAETGLMVGGSSSALEIGGTDKQVVRNPINKMPYIPGSSLKGKMRSLFELSRGQISAEEKGFGPTMDDKHEAAQLFGFIKGKQNDNKKQQPSRLIVRDGEMLNSADFGNTELLYTEVKSENTIDRITSAANPRFFERVPKGARFQLNMVINVFNSDINGEHFLNLVYEALRLVQDDYVGGGGSRGNGQISIKLSKVEEKPSNYYKLGAKSEIVSHTATIPADLKAA